MSADLNLSLSAVNYAELLRLTLPEITVALTAPLVVSGPAMVTGPSAAGDSSVTGEVKFTAPTFIAPLLPAPPMVICANPGATLAS